MNYYRKLGYYNALTKFASDNIFKVVGSKGPSAPKPANTTGSQRPLVPKPVSNTPSDKSIDQLAPDAMNVSSLMGAPAQTSISMARSLVNKTATFNMGMQPEPKIGPGEISPDNGQSLYEVNNRNNIDRFSLIDQLFRNISSVGAANNRPEEF
jgi:hypothetical protein